MRALLLLMLTINPTPSDDSFTEITLERTPCKGTCPVDRIVLRSDGTASYTATAHVKLRGVFKGNVERREFEELAKLIADKGFFDLKSRYETERTCQPTVITTVKRGEGKKAVSNYGGAGPRELRAIEERIIDVIAKVEWKRDSSAPQPAGPPDAE